MVALKENTEQLNQSLACADLQQIKAPSIKIFMLHLQHETPALLPEADEMKPSNGRKGCTAQPLLLHN